jgi:hypothetical protein
MSARKRNKKAKAARSAAAPRTVELAASPGSAQGLTGSTGFVPNVGSLIHGKILGEGSVKVYSAIGEWVERDRNVAEPIEAQSVETRA